MEKNILKKTVIIFSILLFSEILFAQTPSVIQHIRFPLWAEIDAYPGSEEAVEFAESEYAYPISRIRQVAPFLVSGMVYGWEFTYSPSDNSRGVDEFFEVKEIQAMNPAYEIIEYSSPWIENERLNCWCEYTRTEYQIQNYMLWSTIKNPVIHGRGSASISKGFDGIKEAAENALKEAVREYYRSLLKNKPKEITGRVLIRQIPTLGIKAGQYIINLDFFLECGTIKEYKMY